MAVLLCIDDQESSLYVRKLFLESQGYTVLTASSGPQGLSILGDQNVDVLILDYRMPGMDGEEVAARARRLRPDLPIIMLSGYVSEFPDALRRLTDDWVTKGDPPAELLEKIARYTGKSVKNPHANRPEDILKTSRGQVEASRQQVETSRGQLSRSQNRVEATAERLRRRNRRRD